MSKINYILACAASALLAFQATAAEQLKSHADVKKALAKHRPMIVMMHAEWCPPCRATVPEYLKAEKKFAGKVDFYFMDADHIMFKLNTKEVYPRGIPAFVAGCSEKDMRSGKSLSEGGMSEADIEAYVTKFTGVKP